MKPGEIRFATRAMIGERMRGKSETQRRVIEFVLDQGKRVLVIQPKGMYIVRKHRSGLKVIMPVK